MKRVLVTGATGGLGRNAVNALLKRGLEVRATGRNRTVGAKLRAQGAEFIELDLTQATRAELESLVDDCDTVWHCAALSSPWGSQSAFARANVYASRELAQAAQNVNVQRFVHISTPALYFDFQHRYDVSEGFKPDQYVNHYAATKAKAEEEVLKFVPNGLHVTILRPRAIFGEYDQVLLPRMLRLVDNSQGKLVLPRGGETLLDFTYVANVVHAMGLASTRPDLPAGEVFNITNGAPLPLKTVLEELIVKRMGMPLNIKSLPYPVLNGIAKIMEMSAKVTRQEPQLTRYSLGAVAFDMTLDISHAQGLLGYLPQVDMEQAIFRTAHWLNASK